LTLTNLLFKKGIKYQPSPLTEKNFDNLMNKSIVLCDMQSKNLWLQVQISVITTTYTFSVEVELKIELIHSLDYLNTLLVKLGLNHWLKKENHKQNFIVCNAVFKTIRSKLNFEYEFMSEEVNYLPLKKCISQLFSLFCSIAV